MGTHNQGLLGAFSGKVGPVIGSTWKEKNVLRARSRKTKSKKTTSEKIIAQRARFSLANKFLRSMYDLFGVTFPEFATNMTSRNSALASIIREAITGTYPDFTIMYEAVRVSRGNVARPYSGTVASTVPGEIRFSWLNNTNVGTTAKADDNAILVAYCPEFDACIFTLTGGLRPASGGSLNIPFFSGKIVHTWLAFSNAPGTKASDSLYTGSLTVA